MLFKKIVLLTFFYFFIVNVFCDDNIDKLFILYPETITSASITPLSKSEETTIRTRTDMLPKMSFKELSVKNNILYYQNKEVVFLDAAKSKEAYSSYYERITNYPNVIYRFDFDIEQEGEYFLKANLNQGSYAFLNGDLYISNSRGLLCKNASGKSSALLKKGKNVLFISALARNGITLNSFRFIPLNQLEVAKAMISKRIAYSTKEDIEWAKNAFLPTLTTLSNGIYTILNYELDRLNKAEPFIANQNTVEFLLRIKPDIAPDAYFVEEYIFTNFTEIYFFIYKNDGMFNGFLMRNNNFQFDFLDFLIRGCKREKENLFMKKAEATILALNGYATKEQSISNLYSARFTSIYQMGRNREAYELFEETKAKVKDFAKSNFNVNDKPDREDAVTLTQSFDETTAFQLQELLESYEGKPEQLQAIYKAFMSISNTLVKRNDGAIGLQYLFDVSLNSKPKLKEDFSKLAQEKVQPLVDKAKESMDYIAMEKIISTYERYAPLPELHLLLLERYFLTGDFVAATSHAKYLYNTHTNLQNKVVARLALLEDFANLPLAQRTVISEDLIKTSIKLKGMATTVKAFLGTINKDLLKTPGSLLATVPLELSHVQYYNHPHFGLYQSMEAVFNKNNILLNGGRYLLNFSLIKNAITWKQSSLAEYIKEDENGPFQKRFFVSQCGGQIFTFTNCDNSSRKTIKSFSSMGAFIWDTIDQTNSLVEEPICAPIIANGKLFGFSYSTRDTINTINLSIYDSNTGAQTSRVAVSYVPNKSNTFTQDEHFFVEEGYVYGYTGSGIVMKIDANTGNILWEKGFPMSRFARRGYGYEDVYGYAPSGYIKVFDQVLLVYMPDVQMFTAINKNTGDVLWRNAYFAPNFIHARDKMNAVYFSDSFKWKEPSLYKMNPKTGEIVWQAATNGLRITGEGDLFGDKLWLPCDRSILEFDSNTGKVLNTFNLPVQPLKIQGNQENAVLFTIDTAYLFKNDGVWNLQNIKPSEPVLKSSKIIEPDVSPQPTITYEDINLELTLKIPETYYTSPDPWKQTQLLKTSKNFHYILKNNPYLTLFREGYHQKNGEYIPPEIIWAEQYPYYDIVGDTLYISEQGKVTARNLFTREKLWEYQEAKALSTIDSYWKFVPPIIAANEQYICFQTSFYSICVIDAKTHQKIREFYSMPKTMFVIYKNYLVTNNYGFGSGNDINCLDIEKEGKQLWQFTYSHLADLFIENGTLAVHKTNNSVLEFYEFESGKNIVSVPSQSLYIMNRFKYDEKFIWANRGLYNSKTGKPLEKYQAGTAVDGGGYLGFYKRYGREGDYVDADGKAFSFVTKGNFSDDNYRFVAKRKGKRIVLFSFFFIEVFEISDNKLISIDYSTISTGQYGNHANQTNMDLFVLEDSLLEIRTDMMYFYRNFDAELNYEEVKSFQVENKKQYKWPFSELYPEVELTDKNWISYFGEKPKQSLSYQLFSDEQFAYLYFKLSPQNDSDTKQVLYISSDGIQEKISFIWDINLWNKAQTSYFVGDKTESWKEVDIKGNIKLFFRIQLTGTYSTSSQNTLPIFNIELRQITKEQNVGMYRFGGAYQGLINQIPWLKYMNDEAQSLKNFYRRTTQYSEHKNFYPQGYDIIYWIKDRRRLKGVDNNINLLNQILSDNIKYYGSVNILAALMLEEIQNLKEKSPNLDQFADDYPNKIQEIVKRLHSNAIAKGMSKEWADFALTFWSFEIFPYKFSIDYSRDIYRKPYNSVLMPAKNNNRFSFTASNLFSRSINHPYIEWAFPALIADYPNNVEISKIVFQSFCVNKTVLGKMIHYSPNVAKEFIKRNGSGNDFTPNISIDKDDSKKLEPKEAIYYYKGVKYIGNILNYERPVAHIAVTLPKITMPTTVKNTEQTSESILTTLDNLPTDSDNGLMVINSYINLKGKVDEDEMIKIYSKWLGSMRDSSVACKRALGNILNSQKERANVFEFIDKIIRSAKLPAIAPRAFNVERRNLFKDVKSRSILGPYFADLVNKPENNLDGATQYKSIDNAYTFKDMWSSEKGGAIYLASKITYEGKKNAYLFLKAVGDYNTQPSMSIFSVWLNGEQIVNKVVFKNFDDNTFFQKLALKKGENTLLIQLNGMENVGWGGYYFYCLGDNYAAPLQGLTVTPIHKP